jgi:hypothetical protein
MRPTLFVLPLKFVSKHLQMPDLGRIVDYGEVSILPEPAASPAPPEKAKGFAKESIRGTRHRSFRFVDENR